MHLFPDDGALHRRSGKLDGKAIGCCAGLGLFLLLCLGAGGAGGYYWYKTETEKAAKQAERQRILDALRPELPKLLEAGIVKPGREKSKFKGKVVCIDRNTNQLDEEAVTELPDGLIASKPDEIGAIVWLTWREEQKGTYPDGSKAKIYTVALTLIEKQTSSLLCHREIEGEIVAEKSGSGDRMGPKPWDKIAKLLGDFKESD